MSLRVDIHLATAYGQAYPVSADLLLAGFRGVAGDEVVAELALAAGRPGLAHLLVAWDGAPPTISPSLTLVSRFPAITKPLIKRLQVTPVYEAGPGTPYHLTLELYPRESYASSGLSVQPDALLLTSKPLLQWQSPAADAWPLLAMSDEELAYARRQWGPVVTAATGDLDQAQGICLALAGELATSNGVPSDALMASPPFRQHALLVSGQARGYCENAAAIFVHACQAFAAAMPAEVDDE